MGEGTGSLVLQWVDRIEQIPQGAWDALALPLATPFLEWHWLRNLENSGSAIPQAGWLPRHLTVWRQGTLIAAAPLYIKGHSQGEFVFDHQWADLSQRLGIRYYPKLLGMTPFTPAQGYRFLIAPGEDEASLTAAMLAEIDRFAQANHFSGCNFLFVDPDWQPLVEACGYRAWLHHSYVWQNRNYTTFDDYLGAFNANQRRNIKRERKAVSQAGLEMVVHRGEDVSRTLLSRMYHFYGDTCDKFGWWGSKYLTKAFFEQLHRDFQQRVVLVTAYREGDRTQPIGMSFCIRKAENLYGRYWGSLEEIDCLHFEACYYQPIDWAISERIQMFDPGAGGRHKKRRGFPATPNYSLHRFYAPRLSQILDHYIAEINQQEQAIIDEVNQDLPFKA
ncbi:GNAT family N-acetyltransferase [Thermosynechococcaceae cyanobacterium BACA0444]|uniref:GNAT family N-acetyltransferase n=1 Tax=Pseudocalidococcus azoricus BACA0444 TaxID=2918990 RepID=A0AAE4JWR4_9CYAN|nr:GNAT family N-acetyltransferase [Pseudocalidococcus azoricus]MDS3861675.1 GNAT family N-acetyltransferase [Pseudocalidococcus azoricus BACA0444]